MGAAIMNIHIARTSGREPPCEGCQIRQFQRTGVRGQGKLYCMTFDSFDALTAWLRSVGSHVVLSLFNNPGDTWADGKPAPAWSIEIYDDYRE
jgi:hypothetical protein